MLHSMTGFGQAAHQQKNWTVEIKSLNSKSLDITMRLPASMNSAEMDIRLLLAEKLEKGKIQVTVTTQVESASRPLNEEKFLKTYHALQALADKTKTTQEGLFQLAYYEMKNSEAEIFSDEDKLLLMQLIQQAVDGCRAFREQEGRMLAEKLTDAIRVIKNELAEIRRMEKTRAEKIKARLQTTLSSWLDNAEWDKNRLEQEMIYYIEKIDIHEEMDRLDHHLAYFMQQLKEEKSAGKKLTFIAQEIGREINTLGAKANDASVQHRVVVMKEELEKIKEQLNNVL